MNAAVIPEQKAIIEQPKPTSESVQLTQTDDKQIDSKIITVETGPGRYIFSVFHTIMSLVAIYLSFRCNKGFEIGPFLVALCCPYIYIIYILATRGTCGIIESENRRF